MQRDTVPIVRLGSSIKNIGYAQIIIFIGSIIIGIFLFSRIVSIVVNSTSFDEALLELKETLRFFLILLLLLSLITTYAFYRLYQSIKLLQEDSEYSSPLLDRAAKLFALIITIQILSIFSGIYFINLILDDLEELATSNPTTQDIENFGNNFNTNAEIIVSSIVGIVTSFIMLLGFNSIKDWTDQMNHKTKIFWFSEAANKLKNVVVGLMIIIAGQIFNLISLSAFGDLILFIGSIVIIISYIQVGNRFERLSLNPNVGIPTFVGSGYGYQQSIENQPAKNNSNIEHNYCTTCGSSISPGSQFCNNCGIKLS